MNRITNRTCPLIHSAALAALALPLAIPAGAAPAASDHTLTATMACKPISG